MDQWALGCWGLASQTPPPMEGNSPAEIQCIPSLAFVSLRAERAPDPSSEANSGHLINACSVEAELGLAKPRQGRRPEDQGGRAQVLMPSTPTAPGARTQRLFPPAPTSRALAPTFLFPTEDLSLETQLHCKG